jgi:branched-subunit amino acid aminotransferase/4-amino-4-deoxychorismate lyase
VQDAGFAYGAGVFTTLRVHRGCPLFLTAHLERLQEHAARLGFTAADRHRTTRELMHGLALNGMREGVIKIITTPGTATVSLDGGKRASLIIMFLPPRRNPGPVRLLVTPCTPSPWRSLKSTAYLDSVTLLQRARRARCHDALALCDGQLLESGRANLFAITQRRIHTPPADGRILAGIARAQFLTQDDLAVEERPVRRAGLRPIEALFLTNCVRGVIPVASLWDEKGREIWRGDPGHPQIEHARQVWRRMVRSALASDPGRP